MPNFTFCRGTQDNNFLLLLLFFVTPNFGELTNFKVLSHEDSFSLNTIAVKSERSKKSDFIRVML